ncbi:multidrug effflux MFS transporter [Tolypothrix campylonemoides VB511288]|nr:multidrug effflux MFS transporter [Tolypothrix campylonemoides VB511288]
MAAPTAPASRVRLAVLLGGLAMFGPFSIDTIFPAFPQIGAQLAADKVAMQQTISVYLVAYALMSIVHGPVSDAIGRRRVILTGLTVFGLASVGCALATDLTTLLAFRAVQGLSAGVGLIVGRAVIRDVYQGDDAQRLMSQVSMIFGIAPAIAPIIGGWLLGFGRWPLIFWFLVAFTVGLIALTFVALPETHPREARLSLAPKRLLRDYAGIFTNPSFQRLSLASTFGFNGLFLYIASAPAFVMDVLGLDERQFGWFFVPTIGGMVLGAFISGRLAGRMNGARMATMGFAISGVAGALNILYNALVADPAIPLAVLPMSLNALGIALVFPIVTLAILDMYPRQRGSASSLQAFVGLVINALIAGALSPLISHTPLAMALVSAGFTALGYVFWRWEITRRREPPKCTADAAALEPTERL